MSNTGNTGNTVILFGQLFHRNALPKLFVFDVDYTLSAFMKINDYLSTTLIVQCLYDDNAIKKIQLREVFGLAFVIDIMEIPKII